VNLEVPVNIACGNADRRKRQGPLENGFGCGRMEAGEMLIRIKKERQRRK